MKKIFLLLSAFTVLSIPSIQAQRATPRATPPHPKAAVTAPVSAPVEDAAVTNKPHAVKSTGPVKKDGTPDMRYKANQPKGTTRK